MPWNLSKVWCRIDPAGTIEFIDWDEAERLLEQHRSGERRDDNTAIAALAVGVREYVLRAVPPKIVNKKEQHE